MITIKHFDELTMNSLGTLDIGEYFTYTIQASWDEELAGHIRKGLKTSYNRMLPIGRYCKTMQDAEAIVPNYYQGSTAILF